MVGSSPTRIVLSVSAFDPPGPSDPSAGSPPVLVRRLDPAVPVPTYAHPGDAGADLCTAVDVEIGPGERAVLPTGCLLYTSDAADE